jgi:Holliday junction DNA helicase RuvA
MIGRISGKVADKSTEGVLVDVHGVGYDISLPLSTLAGLPPTGQQVTLFIHTYVREDDLRLFGFSSKRDRTAFRTMLKVSGVGPKLAVAVLGALSGEELGQAIQNSDTRRLTAIPGIGKKTAERMILELGGKLEVSPENGSSKGAGGFTDLASALVNLGFKTSEVDKALAEIRSLGGENQTFEALLRQALGLLKER